MNFCDAAETQQAIELLLQNGTQVSAKAAAGGGSGGGGGGQQYAYAPGLAAQQQLPEPELRFDKYGNPLPQPEPELRFDQFGNPVPQQTTVSAQAGGGQQYAYAPEPAAASAAARAAVPPLQLAPHGADQYHSAGNTYGGEMGAPWSPPGNGGVSPGAMAEFMTAEELAEMRELEEEVAMLDEMEQMMAEMEGPGQEDAADGWWYPPGSGPAAAQAPAAAAVPPPEAQAPSLNVGAAAFVPGFG